MTYKKKILIVTPYPLFPCTSGGKKYIIDGIKFLSKKFNYHLLAFQNLDEKNEYKKNKVKLNKLYKKYFNSITFVERPKIPYEKNIYENIKHFIVHIIYSLPLMDCSYYNKDAIEKSKILIKRYKIDILECHHLQTAFLRRFINIKSSLVYHNIESKLFPFWLLPKEKNIFIRIVWKLFALISRHNSSQVEINNRFGFNVGQFISQKEMNDVNNIQKIWRPPITKTNPKLIFKNSKIINVLWVGGFDWLPNYNAGIWFAQKIYPIINSRFNKQKIHFQFIGNNPPDELKKIENKNISIYGYVENIDEFWKNADIFIVPILEGGGVRIKIIDAMSYGIPVVSTAKGAEGLAVTNKKNIYIADNPKEFCDYILKLSQEKNLRNKMSNESISYIKKYHSKKSLYPIVKLFNKL